MIIPILGNVAIAGYTPMIHDLNRDVADGA